MKSKLFVRKHLSHITAEEESGEHKLKRTLGAGSLIALGIGAIIGAGIFVLTGHAAAANAAKSLGYTNVKHLVAGISGWKKAGEKTETGE